MKILIMDDDSTIRLTLGSWLDDMGHAIKLTCNGEQGIQAFAEQSFDLVICDIDMPGLDSFEVVKKLRQLQQHWVPIIFLNTFYQDAHYERGSDVGGDFYFNKPLRKKAFYAQMKGINCMHEVRVALQSLNSELTSLRDNTHDGMLSIDGNSVILSANNAAHKMFGYEHGELFKLNVNQLIPDSLDKPHKNTVKQLVRERNQGVRSIVGKKKDGVVFPIDLTITPIISDNGLVFTVIMRNMSRQKKLENDLKSLAHYDILTGLPNRVLFTLQLVHAISRSNRENSDVVLMFLDLDRFKDINDTLGHNIGDELLKQVGKRLKKGARGSDTIARLGGDEFTILMEGFTSKKDVMLVADKILNLMKEPILIGEQELFITVSIGIAIHSCDDSTSTDVIKQADAAMYKAKTLGKNQYCFYDSELNDKNIYRMELSNTLNRALKRKELKIYYQPKLDIKTGVVNGAEALLRWTNEHLGNVSPTDFIPILEDTGLIISVTEWVLKESTHQWKNWINSGVIGNNAKLSVNLSTKNFICGDICGAVADALSQSKLSPNNLTLELTESIMMQHSDTVLYKLGVLKQQGINISLDDFGTGYSSLSYLSKFPIDEVKIDRSFLDKIGDSHQDRILISAIIEMSHKLGKHVVAEGVDTPEKLNFLLNLNCDSYQGFLYAPALAPPNFEKKVQSRKVNLPHNLCDGTDIADFNFT